MRIVHLGALYPPYGGGGAERSVAMLAEAQVRAGHEVTTVSFTPDAFVEEERNGVRVFRVPHETLYWSSDFADHGPLAFHWRKFAMPFNRRQRRHVERVLDLVRPEIVNTHSMVDVSTGIWPAVTRRGYPLVHTLRDYDLLCADGSAYHDGQPCGARCRVMTAAKKIHQGVLDAVVGISNDVLQQHLNVGLFRHIAPDRQRVIWNSARVAGIGPGYRRPDRAGLPFTFGFLGRLTKEKGVGLLIDAARRLPKDGSWSMVIAGRTASGANPFVSAAEGLPIALPGQMEPHDFFERIDVLVVPSIWDEPFGRVVIEAYSAGVPVLASRSGGMPDLIAGNRERWTVAPGDLDALAGRMRELLAAGRSALPSADAFAEIMALTEPASIERQYRALYETLIASSTGRIAA